MNTFVALLFLLSLLSTQASLNWNVHKKIKKFGETLLLFCKPDECCSATAGWVKWKSSMRFETIVFGMTDSVSNADSKYDGKIGDNGFYLYIRNVSKSDINVNLSCTYGLLISSKKLLRETDVFEGTKSTITKTVEIGADMFFVIMSIFLIIATVIFVWVFYVRECTGKQIALNILQFSAHSTGGVTRQRRRRMITYNEQENECAFDTESQEH